MPKVGKSWPKKGERTPGSGRVKGTPNKKTQTLFEVCEEEGIDPFRGLLMLTKHADVTIKLQALKEVCRYLYPIRKAVEITGAEGAPIETRSRHVEEFKELLETGLNERKRL